MEYVNLGATGLRVSRICLGMMELTGDEMRRLQERYVTHPVLGHG